MREIACPLAQAANTWGSAPALLEDHRTLTYGEYHNVTSHVADQLAQLGVRPTAKVAVLLENRLEYPILVMALTRAGAVACPLNWRMPPEALMAMMKAAGCSHVILDSSRGSGKSFPIPSIDLSSLQFHSAPDSQIRRTLDLDAPATVVFTSGSSGEPKAALHSYGNHYFNALGSNENIPFTLGDCWGLTLPLYHVGGLSILFRAILGGGSVRIVESKDETGSDRLRDVTHLSLVSTQLQRLLDNGALDRATVSHVKAILLGGSSIPDRLIRRACEIGLPLYKSYGLTEMGSQVCTTAWGDLPSKDRSSGKLLRYRELRIAFAGEIFVRGETRFAGYVNGNRVEQPFDSEGWFHTGDLGLLDADGYLIVTGRKDNMFISGGENIQPEEIERALLQIEGVTNAIVVPVPHEKWGFRPVAFVEMVTGTALNADDLAAELKRVLPGYKLPDRFLPFPASDDQPQLKVSRARLMTLAQAESISK